MSVGVDVSDSLNATNGDTRFFQDFYFGDQNVGSPFWMGVSSGQNKSSLLTTGLLVVCVGLAVYMIAKKKKGR